jgi:16S rRNA (guanine966-N2)-methyltransferase
MTPTPKANSPKSSWKRPAAKGKKEKRPVHAGRTKPGNIRIISGQHRGRKLPVLIAEGLRPTSDRVKETLFNWLMQDIAGAKVLDMFAGSGSLGFEALSRGAEHVTMIENNRDNAAQLSANAALLRAEQSCNVINADAFGALNAQSGAFDIVLIDPPFNQGFVTKALDTLLKLELLRPDALVYIEMETENNIEKESEALNNNKLLSKIKEQSTQQVSYRLYRYKASDNSNAD